MAFSDGKDKSPYHGVWVVCLIMIALPLISFFIVYGAISNKLGYSYELNVAAGKIAGCGVGFLFHLGCLIFGTFTKPLLVVIERLKEFFSTLSISVKLAFSGYFDDLKTDGVVFWLYLGIVIANICIFADGLKDFIALYFK